MPEKSKGKETMAVYLLKWTVFFSEPAMLGHPACPEFVGQRMCECFPWSRCGHTCERVSVGLAQMFKKVIRMCLRPPPQRCLSCLDRSPREEGEFKQIARSFDFGHIKKQEWEAPNNEGFPKQPREKDSVLKLAKTQRWLHRPKLKGRKNFNKTLIDLWIITWKWVLQLMNWDALVN